MESRIQKIAVLLIVFCVLFLPKNVLAATSVTTLSQSGTSVGKFQKLELTFQLSKAFPVGSFLPYYYFDPADTSEADPGRNSPYGVDGISVDAHFKSPSGKTLVVPAFYFQDYVRTRSGGEIMTPTSNYMWKVRFTPEEVGTYTYFLTVYDKDGTSQYPTTGTNSFTTTPSSLKGFLRTSPRDSRFLEFSDGESFVPNSAGHQWYTGGNSARSYEYEDTFTDFNKYGINLLRIWDQDEGYGLTVEGHYDAYAWPLDFSPCNSGNDAACVAAIPKGTQMNQRGGYEEDKIIESAEKNGVYIELASHADPYWIWDIKQGGDWSSLRKLNYWKRNFRYRAARWGYSTAILTWEHWNELGHILPNSDIWNFYASYSAYQSQVDPFRHLRTTSQGSQAYSPAFWSSNIVDLTNYHDYMMISRYSADLTYDAANFVYRFAQCLRVTNPSSCGLGLGDGTTWSGNAKPVIWGELDTGTTDWNIANPQPKAAHDMRWAGLFSPIGTTGIDWYYQNQSASFIQTKYNDAKVASNFFKGVDYAGKNFTYLSTSDVALSTSKTLSAQNSNLRVLAMQAASKAEAFAWVQNKGNAFWNSTTIPAALSSSFTLTGMNGGNYLVSYWDTYTGAITESTIASSNGNLIVPVNNLTKDIAIKMTSTSLQTSTPKPGDADGNSVVDGLDYIIWLTNYNTAVTTGRAKGDFNQDGKVDGLDYIIWLTNYGK